MLAEAKIPERIQSELEIFAVNVLDIAARFRQEMEKGLAGQNSSLKMLSSFLDRPSGNEQGTFLALDFGGSNIRLIEAELAGRGRYRIRKRQSWPLRDPANAYDFTSHAASGEELFDFIARQIARMVSPAAEYPLGHTFSFPCRQVNVNQAVLLTWTKEIKTAGVEGQEVNSLLAKALERNHVRNVTPAAIINDTVGTLLAAAYGDSRADIGAICGTGHNICYHEPHSPPKGQPVIINMEAGGFANLPLTRYDRQLDMATEKPGSQIMEKMVAGRYLGEITRLIIADLVDAGALPPAAFARVFTPYSLTAEDVSRLLADNSGDLAEVEKLMAEKFGWKVPGVAERQLLKKIAAAVAGRSARLAAAAFAGILQHLDPVLERKHTIAIDGSVYEKMPGYADGVRQALAGALGGKSPLLTIALTKDGSGVGAAIAAAIACGR